MTCPRCGAPSGSAFCGNCGTDLRTPQGPPTPPSRREPEIGCAGLILVLALTGAMVVVMLAILVLSTVSRTSGNFPGVEVPLARFRVSDTVLSDECSTLFDVCVRTTCVIQNDGLADGTATVLFDLNPGTTHPVQATETVFVPAGASRSVVHDFREASFGERSRGLCTLR